MPLDMDVEEGILLAIYERHGISGLLFLAEERYQNGSLVSFSSALLDAANRVEVTLEEAGNTILIEHGEKGYLAHVWSDHIGRFGAFSVIDGVLLYGRNMGHVRAVHKNLITNLQKLQSETLVGDELIKFRAFQAALIASSVSS